MKRTLQQREENAGKMSKGNAIEVLMYMTPQQAIDAGVDQVLVPVIGSDQYCRGVDDVESVMEELDLDGEFIPVRRASGIMRRQAVVRIEKSDDGFKGFATEAPPEATASEDTAPENPNGNEERECDRCESMTTNTPDGDHGIILCDECKG